MRLFLPSRTLSWLESFTQNEAQRTRLQYIPHADIENRQSKTTYVGQTETLF